MIIWKDHPRYPGEYQVSSSGEVRSLTRMVPTSYGAERVNVGRVMSQSSDKVGRRGVNLLGQNERVHRLVLEAFVGPCPAGMECRHLNGNCADNRVENLAWGTHAENCADMIRHGTSTKGERSASAKLNTWAVLWIKKITKHGFAEQKYLAEIFGVSDATISMIKTGAVWSHV